MDPLGDSKRNLKIGFTCAPYKEFVLNQIRSCLLRRNLSVFEYGKWYLDMQITQNEIEDSDEPVLRFEAPDRMELDIPNEIFDIIITNDYSVFIKVCEKLEAMPKAFNKNVQIVNINVSSRYNIGHHLDAGVKQIVDFIVIANHMKGAGETIEQVIEAFEEKYSTILLHTWYNI